MYNEKRVKFVRRVTFLLLFAAGLLVGIGVSQLVGQPKEKNATKTEQTIKKTIEEKTKKKALTSEEVKNFLIAYYTKKDLSENRKRYKPFMTAAMYTQETDIEELPINQAYKGYVINQVFDSADIYIDNETLVALVDVKYHNTQLVEKGTTEGALIDTPETQTLKISFVEEKGRYKVNNINKIFLTTTGETSRTNTYDEEEEDTEVTSDQTEASGGSKENIDQETTASDSENSSETTKTSDMTAVSGTETGKSE